MSSEGLTIGYSGLSHLGLVHAVASASKGLKIIARDSSVRKIKNLQNDHTDINEPSLTELLINNKKNLKFTTEVKDLLNCDIIFVSLDVETDISGKSELSFVRTCIDEILEVIDESCVLVILSQIPPGFTRKINSKYSKFIIYCQVETLIFGEAIDRALFPERFIVGCIEPNMKLNEKYHKFLKMFNCPVLPMLYESAELTKISINAFLAASVTMSNTLAEISEIIGANWSDVIPSLKLDKRIGHYSYVKPGLGLSGGNIERDLHTIAQLGKKCGTHVNTVNAIIENSQHRKDWLWRIFKDTSIFEIKNSRIAVLGLSYKENTSSIKNAPSLNFISKLSEYRVSVHDPVVKTALPNFVTFYEKIYDCIKDVDLLVIATPWQDYKNLDLDKVKESMHGITIIDPFELINYDLAREMGFLHICLGKKL